MIIMLILVISISISAGLLLLFSRDLFRVVMGLAVMSMAVNLIVFLAGRPGSIIPPVIGSEQSLLSMDAANPLSQALVLTAIVIGFALLSFSLVLAALASHQRQTPDIAKLKDSEPQNKQKQRSDKPPIVEGDL